MAENDYLKDISEIKDIMSKSTRFMSLSGLSGILAGIYALAGAFIANMLLAGYDGNYMANENMLPIGILEIILVVVGLVVALLSFITGYILTKRTAKRNDEKIWTPLSKQLLLHFLIPMIAGGLFILLLINKGYYGLVAPLTLVFYGLALVSASKYTLGLIKYLGLIEILLGLLAFYFFGNGLLFWALGFGVLHVVYGAFMHFKLDK